MTVQNKEPGSVEREAFDAIVAKSYSDTPNWAIKLAWAIIVELRAAHQAPQATKDDKPFRGTLPDGVQPPGSHLGGSGERLGKVHALEDELDRLDARLDLSNGELHARSTAIARKLVALFEQTARAEHQAPPSLLRPVGAPLPQGCYCTDKCMAPVVMGVQTPCRRASSVAAVGAQAAEQGEPVKCAVCGFTGNRDLPTKVDALELENVRLSEERDHLLKWLETGLTWGKNKRAGDDREHMEWHAKCGCAYHPEPFPHVHPCSDAHKRSDLHAPPSPPQAEVE